MLPKDMYVALGHVCCRRTCMLTKDNMLPGDLQYVLPPGYTFHQRIYMLVEDMDVERGCVCYPKKCILAEDMSDGRGNLCLLGICMLAKDMDVVEDIYENE